MNCVGENFYHLELLEPQNRKYRNSAQINIFTTFHEVFCIKKQDRGLLRAMNCSALYGTAM